MEQKKLLYGALWMQFRINKKSVTLYFEKGSKLADVTYGKEYFGKI